MKLKLLLNPGELACHFLVQSPKNGNQKILYYCPIKIPLGAFHAETPPKMRDSIELRRTAPNMWFVGLRSLLLRIDRSHLTDSVRNRALNAPKSAQSDLKPSKTINFTPNVRTEISENFDLCWLLNSKPRRRKCARKRPNWNQIMLFYRHRSWSFFNLKSGFSSFLNCFQYWNIF